MSNEQIVILIKENLSTSKKFINANYTKNNFKLLKEKFPDIWFLLKEKEITYNNKIYSFFEKSYKNLQLNGILIKSCGWKNKNLNKLIEYANIEKINNLKDLIRLSSRLKLSGVKILHISRDIFPQDYKIVADLFKKCNSEREALYCFLHDIKPLYVNDKKLSFQTLAKGYSFEEFAKLFNSQCEKNFLKNVLCSNFCIKRILDFIKEFAPNILKQCSEWCDVHNLTTNNISEKIFLYAFDINTKGICKWCNNVCAFLNIRTGYRDFCSLSCKSRFKALEDRKFKDIKAWKQYKRTVHLLTNFTLKIFPEKFDFKSFKRGKKNGEFQVDHIISKLFCFENNIDPRRAAHWKNLQIIESSINKKKGARVLNLEYLSTITNIKNEEMIYFNEYFRTIIS